jgi:hypothetical protein
MFRRSRDLAFMCNLERSEVPISTGVLSIGRLP